MTWDGCETRKRETDQLEDTEETEEVEEGRMEKQFGVRGNLTRLLGEEGKGVVDREETLGVGDTKGE